jgi:hypothetical protein
MTSWRIEPHNSRSLAQRPYHWATSSFTISSAQNRSVPAALMTGIELGPFCCEPTLCYGSWIFLCNSSLNYFTSKDKMTTINYDATKYYNISRHNSKGNPHLNNELVHVPRIYIKHDTYEHFSKHLLYKQ